MASGQSQLPPSGMVAFVFTDIEASTRLWADDGDQMRQAVERHDELIRDAASSESGFVFSTGGDGFAIAFSTSKAAVDAAEAMQHVLSEVEWPTLQPLKVRIGVHLGTASERGGDYFGPAVNLAARVCDAGHGGQIVVTDVVAQTCGRATIDLGPHPLKDIATDTRLHQVGEGSFPPLRTPARVRNTLPMLRTKTVGRDDFVSRTRHEFESTRLVTLTGAGGAGKTRAAVEVASAALHDFPEGVFFADLTAVDAEDRLWPAIQTAIDLVADGDARRRVVDFLRDRRVLLVLDNCEQLIDEIADAVDDFLEATSGPVVLATSREALDVPGERVVRVPPLAVGDASRLFVQRAADLGAELGSGDAEAVTRVCEQLDGIPLAVELAAARCVSMTPREILGRLDERFTLLGGGRGRRRRRQQTLAAVMDWSHQLLSSSEQALFRRLGVFSGRFDRIDVEAVVGQSPSQIDPLLESLVAKSLVDQVRTGEAIDLRLLESTRLYALDRLVEAGEAADMRESHARHFGLSQIGRSFNAVRTQSPEEADREIRRVENLEAALGHLIDTGRSSEAAAVVATRSLGLLEIGRLQAYRWLFVADHAEADVMVRRRIFDGSGVWAAFGEFDLVDHLARTSREAAASLQLPTASEAHSAWVWSAAMTEGIETSLALAEQLLRDADTATDASPTGIAAIRMYQAMGFSLLGQFAAAAEASLAGFRASPLSTNGVINGVTAVWYLVDQGRRSEAVAVVESLPPPRPGAFAYLQPLARAMALVGTEADAVVAAALIKACESLVPGRIPSQEGDFLPAFVKLRVRSGHVERAREIVDNLIVRLLGGPANQLIAMLQEWPDDEREERGLQLTAAMLDPVERQRRQQASIEMLAEEVSFWQRQLGTDQAEIGVPE